MCVWVHVTRVCLGCIVASLATVKLTVPATSPPHPTLPQDQSLQHTSNMTREEMEVKRAEFRVRARGIDEWNQRQ